MPASPSPENDISQNAQHPLYASVDRQSLSPVQRRLMNHQVERLWERFRQVTRRLGMPLAHSMSAIPAFSNIADQARTLSNVVHRELIQFEHDAPQVMPVNVIHELIRLNEQWIERLENQIWLLENSLRDVKTLLQFREPPSADNARNTLADVADFLLNELRQIPEPELILHEPGLDMGAEILERGESLLPAEYASVSNSRAAGRMAQSVLIARFSGWLVSRSSQREELFADCLVRASRLAQNENRVTAASATQEKQNGSSAVFHVVQQFVRRLLQFTQQHRERNVLPSLQRAWQPAVQKFLADAQRELCDIRLANQLIASLELDVTPDTSREELERLVLFKRLRRHAPEKISKPKQKTSSASEAVDSPVPAPKFLRRMRKETQKSKRIPASRARSFRIDRGDTDAMGQTDSSAEDQA